MQGEDYILELLINAGLIQPTDAEEARAAANGKAPVQELIGRGLLTQTDVLRTMANEAGMSMLERIDHVTDDVVKAFKKEYAERYKVFPLSLDDNILRLAVTNPYDFETIDTLQSVLNMQIECVVVPEDEIQAALKTYYGSLGDSIESLMTGMDDGSDLEVKPGTVMAEIAAAASDKDAGDAPIIKMVHLIILEAHRMRASDIHIEPLEKRLRLRYRVDGRLQEVQDPPKRLQAAIIARLKVMADMSIAEKRLPQDGRIQLKISERQAIDLRVSSVPTVHGESIVMRILDKTALLLGLPELGFLSDDQTIMEKLLALPDGIFLVTGPTGSGKTTTLYACLNYINTPDRKLITVEDPVEYQLAGINQVPVNEDVGMTFAAALRAMLRQAPNVIMIGEIRDMETATIAINASLTGHLVFSTLHTNDAPSAITRLVDIGVKPFLVASSVRAVMAQRLVRRICPNCEEPYEPTPEELRMLNLEPTQLMGANFQRGRGCDNCREKGFKGRLGIFEIFEVDDEIRRMINEKMTDTVIRKRARDLGMRTLREDGIRKVLGGLSTPEEIIAVTMKDKA